MSHWRTRRGRPEYCDRCGQVLPDGPPVWAREPELWTRDHHRWDFDHGGWIPCVDSPAPRKISTKINKEG